MGEPIRVLVVDDSAFMRKIITDILNHDQRIQVVGTARNGKDALEKQQLHKPDVITLDVEMPIMNGLEALKSIMRTSPCPVVMISSQTKKGAEITLLAMEFGAVDFVTKPSGPISLDIGKEEHTIREKVLHAAKANIKPINIEKSTAFQPTYEVKSKPRTNRTMPVSSTNKKKVIAIGTSTGGPRALKTVISQIPATIEAPILIVQHMPSGFTRSLAERLNAVSEINVKEAENGDILLNGTAYIAPGGYHISVDNKGNELMIRTHLEDPRKGHRPSVDVMYESLALHSTIEVVAVIMTGMGADGTEGLRALKAATPCYSIVEAEESCVVFGMPKAAIKANLVDEVVHVQHIAGHLVRYLTR
ncbi:protein-glutamate methylesterase/protein-glutamine glutaminase [Bacillus suaedae]|uniref:Protein-glutamate methylesterase/protein-glutamine glutaminase n=1 Tax=Halalkalibacter suaedae TaxID=2822140 RepID=A0A941APY3_9BACI|nr:chemotaxis response regulator protein-glutamate methylesterase [Bacillus suaedae]MBP3952017.1 chemotaxis response regulator protein-glutamate methylesterase [Bacillus suaedae]